MRNKKRIDEIEDEFMSFKNFIYKEMREISCKEGTKDVRIMRIEKQLLDFQLSEGTNGADLSEQIAINVNEICEKHFEKYSKDYEKFMRGQKERIEQQQREFFKYILMR